MFDLPKIRFLLMAALVLVLFATKSPAQKGGGTHGEDPPYICWQCYGPGDEPYTCLEAPDPNWNYDLPGHQADCQHQESEVFWPPPTHFFYYCEEFGDECYPPGGGDELLARLLPDGRYWYSVVAYSSPVSIPIDCRHRIVAIVGATNPGGGNTAIPEAFTV